MPPSSCTANPSANHTISSRISCHITFFRATSAGTREPSTIEEDSLGWKTELVVLYRKAAIANQQQRGGGGELRWFSELRQHKTG